MRKKYLSALLFGALLFASAGTFTSCKDYDDDIKNLQGQIDANADAIKALQDLVNNGDYVTAVKKSDDGKGIVFTFSKSGDQTVTLDIENGQEGDVLSIDPTTGELLKNGEPTGIKPATDPEEVKAPVKAENGVWVFLNDKGEYESTNIPVSGVTAVQNDKKQWVLTITDANGAQSTVVVPSAASVMSDLVLAGWIQEKIGKTLSAGDINTLEDNEKLEVKYCWLPAITKANYATVGDEITWSAQKEVKKGQVLTNLAANNTNLVTRVAPADLDLSGMSFTLQDSKGNTLPIGLNAAKNFTGTLTRAANSSVNTILLDVTSATYANADEYTKLFQGVTGEDENATSNVLYSLVEASGARSNYGLVNVVPTEYTDLRKPKVTSVDPKGTVVTGSTGDGSEKTPFIVDLNTPTRLVFNEDVEGTSDQVYDYYVEVVDKQAGEEFGFSTNIKDGTITLTKSIDLVTKTGLQLNVYALRIDGKVYQEKIWVKPSSIMASEVTLKAGDEIIAPILNDKGQIISNYQTQFVVSLDEMFQSMSETDKARWTSSVTGANGDIVISDVDNDYPATSEALITASFLKADGKAGNNTNAASLLVTIPFAKQQNELTIGDAVLTPDKEYSMLVTFQHREADDRDEEQTVLNTVKLTFTPKLPALSGFMTKRDAYWDGNVLMAYFNDPTASSTYVEESQFDMSYGFTALSKQYKDIKDATYTAMDVDFKLDEAQKIGDDLVADHMEDNRKGDLDIATTGIANIISLGTVDKDTHEKPFAYGENLNVLVGATYMKVYDYSQYASTKSQLEDAAFQIKVQSALEAGTIEPAEGTSIVLTPSGAGQPVQITAKDIIGYAYNREATYSLFKVKPTETATADWAYAYIQSVKFESVDKKLYTVVQKDGEAVEPTWNDDTKKENPSYIELQPVNTTQEVSTTVKVTVIDMYGYEKVVYVPITIKKAATTSAGE